MRGNAVWKIAGGRVFTPSPFLVAGVVNVTPDSFSDGGRYTSVHSVAERIRNIIAEGADMIDLGAESTRPGAEDIGYKEEWQRLAPALAESLASRVKLLPGSAFSPYALAVSIDTFRAATAALALDPPQELRPQPGMRGANTETTFPPGVDIINDVSGGSFDPEILDVVASHKPGYVLGHSPSRPDSMQRNPHYENVVDELIAWFSTRMDALVKAGLPEEHICLDPCIGFGKNLRHTLDIFEGLPRLLALGRPLYFGISRKSFLGHITGLPVSERDSATQVATALLARAGVAIHRVHDVAGAVAALRLARAWP